MKRCRWLAGAAGLSLLLSSVGSWAQQAAPQAPTECSWLGCLFGSRPTAPQPGEAQAPPANEATAAGGQNDASKAAIVTKAAKPAHVITIAAEGPEVARLKRLAAALPKEKIKIVASRKGGHSPDFSVSTDLAPSKAEKAKLFTEQMHIVAGRAVQSVSDLEGKVVSFGPDKSAGQAAARKAFEALNVRVQETPLEVENALDGLATGDVDAVILLAPQPIERLKTISTPGVHLVSWPEGGSLPSGAVASSIDASAYPTLGTPGDKIRAMGVDATLNISEEASKQAAAKTFLKALSEHSDSLTKRGFDLLKTDLESRKRGFVASADKT